ncbi:MAG: hypothetical protein D6732_25655 [Methanobacteriota archaeon]|nr:MAG: hypothetical protein D6732_25655 [Euryarchaeota archaeon]
MLARNKNSRRSNFLADLLLNFPIIPRNMYLSTDLIPYKPIPHKPVDNFSPVMYLPTSINAMEPE